MDTCIFCKIIRKEIPSYLVYEDEAVYAFLDLSQTTKGHTLLIPKKHLVDIFEYDETTAAELFARVPKVARALESALPDVRGINLINNNREVAYQSVFHSHIHLIPRYSSKDDFKLSFTDNSQNYTTDELVDLAQSISEQVSL